MRLKVGEVHRCPECGNLRGKIIWKSKEGETIGIKCARSGHRHKRNSVILVSLKKIASVQRQKHHDTLSPSLKSY